MPLYIFHLYTSTSIQKKKINKYYRYDLQNFCVFYFYEILIKFFIKTLILFQYLNAIVMILLDVYV